MDVDELLVKLYGFGGDGKQPTPRHGITGIGGEIHQHLLDLMAIGKNQHRLFGQMGFALDVFTDNPADKFFNL